MISWPVVVSPVKATLPIPACAGDRRAGRAAGSGHDVDDAGRKAGLEGELAQPDRRQRGPAGRLEDAGVAGRQRRPELPAGHQHREVPGHDQAHDADRLAQGEVETGLADRDRLAEDLVRRPAVVLEDEARPEDLAAGARDRLADVARLEPGELLEVRLHERRELRQGPAALAGRPARPALGVVERAPRRPRPPGPRPPVRPAGRWPSPDRSPARATSNVCPSAASTGGRRSPSSRRSARRQSAGWVVIVGVLGSAWSGAPGRVDVRAR